MVFLIVSASPGWWVRLRQASTGLYRRVAVAAWERNAAGFAEALVPGEGPWLAPATETFAGLDVDVIGPGHPPCDCNRRRGEDRDPTWCPTCGGEIPEDRW